MKVTIQPYDPNWRQDFATLKKELSKTLKEWEPTVEHIGSTAVPGLAAKPIIDIMVGLQKESHLDDIVAPMLDLPYVYYPVYEDSMPLRRLFVRLRSANLAEDLPKKFTEYLQIPHEFMHQSRIANVHIWSIDTPDWKRHIAFRDYLMAFPKIKDQYAQLKQELSKHEWQNMNHYNEGKDSFIKRIEQAALEWYKS